MIEKKPFRQYDLDPKEKKTEVISLKLNKEERELLDTCKQEIEQPKDSTAIKALMTIGAKVILDENTQYIMRTVFKNKKNNERSGRSVEFG